MTVFRTSLAPVGWGGENKENLEHKDVVVVVVVVARHQNRQSKLM